MSRNKPKTKEAEFIDDKSTSTKDRIPVKKLYVSNLPKKFIKGELYSIFSIYGEVQINYPKKNTGYMFITYTDENNALKVRKAANEKKIIYQGEVLNVVPANKQNQPDSKLKMPPKELQSRKRQKKSLKVKNKKSLSLPTINTLDNDCLIKIFSYLPIQDRMRIERVCKRWQTVNQQVWSDIKELEIPKVINFSRSFSMKIKTKERAVKKLLLRCGRFLNKLKLKNDYVLRRFQIIPIIERHCRNLQCLILPLKYYSNFDMTSLFLNLHKLERLELSGLNRRFRDSCLKKLPTNTMKELSLEKKASDFDSDTSYVNITHAGAIGIQNMKNLWKLELNRFSFKADKLKLVVCNESITYLSLKNCSFEKCINLIANIRGLKYLNLSNVHAVDDNFLIKLAANCTELEELNIEKCTDVTNVGINAVLELENLTTLKINYLYEVTGTVFSKFVALKVLHCRNCNLVTDFGVIDLIENAPYIEEIDLSGTSISTRFLDFACYVANNRGNITPLKIIVSSALKLNWVKPLLRRPGCFIVEGREDSSWESDSDDDDLSDSYFFDDEDDIDDDDYRYWGSGPYDADEEFIEGFIYY
ncbi:hypothetical protein PV325_004318 [Microctonus aethiopoides]|nr:hypothetical protein PV325_004318 [Microctonus aethiopoides]